jgi:hypothetical protein
MTSTAEPSIRVNVSDVYKLVLETKTMVERIETELRIGEYEKRLEALERSKWKLSGAASIVAAMTTLIIEKIKIK